MADIGIITRARDDARATLRALVDERRADPCSGCEDPSCALGYGCRHVADPCVECDYSGQCADGRECAKYRPELQGLDRLDLGAEEAQAFARYLAGLKG